MAIRNWKSRPLTPGEIEMVRLLFGQAIEWNRVRIMKEKFAFFQPVDITMAPDGNIWLHPAGHLAKGSESEDFSQASLRLRAHFIHEMTHVWQRQNGMDPILEKFLMLFRHGTLGGYSYDLVPGKTFDSYNIEQQACIIADIYTSRCRKESFPGIPTGTPVV